MLEEMIEQGFAHLVLLVSALWGTVFHASAYNTEQWIEQKDSILVFENFRDYDDADRLKRSVDGSGDDADHGLVNGHLAVTEILAIAIASLFSAAILVFVGSCVWMKTRRRHNEGLILVPRTEDDSALNMVDYDELSIQNAQLTMTLSTSGSSSA